MRNASRYGHRPSAILSTRVASGVRPLLGSARQTKSPDPRIVTRVESGFNTWGLPSPALTADPKNHRFQRENAQQKQVSVYIHRTTESAPYVLLVSTLTDYLPIPQLSRKTPRAVMNEGPLLLAGSLP